jgi:hypothetical protein
MGDSLKQESPEDVFRHGRSSSDVACCRVIALRKTSCQLPNAEMDRRLSKEFLPYPSPSLRVFQIMLTRKGRVNEKGMLMRKSMSMRKGHVNEIRRGLLICLLFFISHNKFTHLSWRLIVANAKVHLYL